jgi:hypothetical protein
MNRQDNLVTVVDLKHTMAAITSTTSETARTNSGLQRLGPAFALLTVGALDIASGDETYVVTVDGRNTGDASYNVTTNSGAGGALATFTLTAVLVSVVGTYIQPIDRCCEDMRVTATLGGTTPSLTYTMTVIAKPVYEPGGLVIAN